MTNGVRPARTSDVDQIAQIQVRAWQVLYQGLFADGVPLAEPASLAEQWGTAILQPPDARARVLVATEAAAVVGFAAAGPCDDPDVRADHGEIHALVVSIDRLRQGHGSRLMAACVEHLHACGYRSLATWTLLGDEPRRAFWQSAGWGPDSARRTLGWSDSDADPRRTLTEVRLVTHLGDHHP